MKSVMCVLALAGMAAGAIPAAQANGTVLVSFCLPLTSRYLKCIDGKVAECVRQRGFNCKSRITCTPTERACDLEGLMR